MSVFQLMAALLAVAAIILIVATFINGIKMRPGRKPPK